LAAAQPRQPLSFALQKRDREYVRLKFELAEKQLRKK
jgi:hypothetical protein